MNFRATAILFGIVFLLAVSLLVAAFTSTDPARYDEGPFGSLTALGINAEEIDTVEMVRSTPNEQKLVFEKAENKWNLKEPQASRVDSAAISGLVKALFELKPAEYSGSLDNPVSLGLGKPTASVTLKRGADAVTLYLGLTTFGSEGAFTFVSTSTDKSRAFAVSTLSLRDSLFRKDAKTKDGEASTLIKWRGEYRPSRILGADVPNPEANAESLTLKRGEKVLNMVRTGGEEWEILTPANYGAADVAGSSEADPLRFNGVRPLLNALQFLQINVPMDVIEDIPNWAIFGLDAKDPATMRIEYASKKGVPPDVLLIGGRVVKDGKPVAPAKFYARLEGDTDALLIPAELVEKLVNTLLDPKALRYRGLLPQAKFPLIDAIDSSFGGGFKLRRVTNSPDGGWSLFGGKTDPTDALLPIVQNLLGKLTTANPITEVLLEPDETAFTKELLKGEISIWTNSLPVPKAGEKAPTAEPKPTGEPIRFLFGKQVDPIVFVRRIDGAKITDFKVPMDIFLNLSPARTAFVNPKWNSFQPSTVERIELNGPSGRTELQRDAIAKDPAYPTGVWNFTGPEALIGKRADGDEAIRVLSLLASLRPVLVAEGEDDLKKYGLDPTAPQFSAKVLLNTEKDKERWFHFGIETEDKKSVYVRLVGKPFVFTVSTAEAAAVRQPSLEDKVLFRVEAANPVTKLYLSGWANLSPKGEVQSANLELKNGIWESIDPPGAIVDTAQVSAVLAALDAPKRIGPAIEKEPDGFGRNLLNIVAELKDKTLVKLSVGPPDATNKGIYVQVGTAYYLADPRFLKPALDRPPLQTK